MSEREGADERRIRHWLRRHGVGPDAPAPAPEPTPEPGRADDWFDRLYADDEPAVPEQETDDDTPWWSLRRPKPEPQQEPQPQIVQDANGVHIVINQPAQPPAPTRGEHRRQARARWFAYHAAAAGVGWCLGLEQAMAAFLDAAGHTATAAGIGLCLVAAIPAVWFPGLPYIPPPLRPATVWLTRIPVSTAALALALHTA